MTFENFLNPLVIADSKVPTLLTIPVSQELGQRTDKIRSDAQIVPYTNTQYGGAKLAIVKAGQNSNTQFYLLVRHESGKAQYVNLGGDKDKARSIAQALIQSGKVSKEEAVQGNSFVLRLYGKSSGTDAAAEEMKARIQAMLAEARASNAEEIERFFFELSGNSPSDIRADQIRKDDLLKVQTKIATESISLRVQRCCDGLISKSQAIAGLPESLANRVASLIDSTIAARSEGSDVDSANGVKDEKRFALLLTQNGININTLNLEVISASAYGF